MNINSRQLEPEQLDDKWIIEYENTDKLYKDFYKDSLYYVHLTIIYVNQNNDIDKIKKKPFLLNTPNILLQEELIRILKQNYVIDGKQYSLLSLLRYNIHLNPNDVGHFLKNNGDYNYYNYLSVIKNINDIHFEKSINMFHDLNDIIIIFYEKQKNLNSKTRKNITKKCYFNKITDEKKKHKKTRRTLCE